MTPGDIRSATRSVDWHLFGSGANIKDPGAVGIRLRGPAMSAA